MAPRGVAPARRHAHHARARCTFFVSHGAIAYFGDMRAQKEAHIAEGCAPVCIQHSSSLPHRFASLQTRLGPARGCVKNPLNFF